MTDSLRAPAHETVAAVDLGSNSFHLIVARVADGELFVLDRLQETVRLAGGLDEKNRLTQEAQRRALDCLKRFGQRLRGMHASAVRAVGTNALRKARNTDRFLARAQRILGHPIEIISGREEARLIYQGVAQELADEGPRLVLDIGGGSTEMILGERLEPRLMESLYMGCVSLSQEYFPSGRISEKMLRRAETAASLELAPVAAQFRGHWRAAYGSSGTIRAAGAILRAAGWIERDITRAALMKLRAAMLDAGRVTRLKLPGLSAERAPVLAGGFAILNAAFEALSIERMQVATSALREGLLYDLIGRLRHEDVRSRTIASLCARYRIDPAQAARVEATAQACFKQVTQDWGLTDEDGALLSRAARLHEIGLAIAHGGYHKHGAYLARYSDLPGFSNNEQQMLALLIRAHRRKFPAEEFEQLSKEQAENAKRLAVLLRFSVLLHRARSEATFPSVELAVGKRSLTVGFPKRWLAQYPLTSADLRQEAEYLAAAGYRLVFE